MTVHPPSTSAKEQVAVDRASIDQLAYIRLGSSHIEAWAQLAHAVGIQVTDRVDGGLDLRLDDREARINVVPGAAHGVLALGWEVETPEQFAAVVEQVRAAGVEVTHCPELAKPRGLCDVVRFADPSGVPHELTWGPQPVIRSPFRSPVQAAFRTGTMCVGHATYAVPDFASAYSFYCGAMGMRANDLATIGGTPSVSCAAIRATTAWR